MIFLNFKIYQETSGDNTIKLCRLIKDKRVLPCLQAVDIYRVKQALPDLEIWAQHADAVDFGKFTGFQSPATLAAAGAGGVMLNHPEHPMDLNMLKDSIGLCKKYQLKTFVDSTSLKDLKKIVSYEPDFVSLEDTKVIAGPVPMIDAQPELIKEAISLAGKKFIIGGGIRTKEHTQRSLKLGAGGVLVASEFAKSNNPEETLKELLAGLDT